MLAGGIIDEAVRLSDPLLDFNDYDALMVVMPSSHFQGGTASLEATTEEAVVPGATINAFLKHPQEPVEWGSIGAHELAHNLGLSDLYLVDSPFGFPFGRPDPPEGMRWVSVEFGLMGLRTSFLASQQDARLKSEWTRPDGSRSTFHTTRVEAVEMLAWSRWQLGWLDETRIRCVDGDDATVKVAPVAEPGSGIAMAAVPLSANEVIVIESRRRIGRDTHTERHHDGPVATMPALLTEGVLVYTVDASIRTGEVPIKVAGDTGTGTVDSYPILTVGDSVTVSGYKITVASDDGDTHTVTIVKTGEA